MKKQKKPFITRVRMFVAAGSFVGLVGGWALLAQADAPAAAANSTTAIVQMAAAQPTASVPTASNPAVATVTATATKATTATRLPVLRTKSS